MPYYIVIDEIINRNLTKKWRGVQRQQWSKIGKRIPLGTFQNKSIPKLLVGWLLNKKTIRKRFLFQTFYHFHWERFVVDVEIDEWWKRTWPCQKGWQLDSRCILWWTNLCERDETNHLSLCKFVRQFDRSCSFLSNKTIAEE
jgi:hypothetical protein